MVTFPYEIVTAMFHSGVSVEEGRIVRDHYCYTEYEALDIPVHRTPDKLEEKVRNATSKTDRIYAIHMLGVSLMMLESLNEENKTGTIELPNTICSKLLNKVSEVNTYLILRDDIKSEITKRIHKITDTGIRLEAMIFQYSKISIEIINSNHAPAALALLKQDDIPTYSIYSLLTEVETPIVTLSRSLLDKICKLCE